MGLGMVILVIFLLSSALVKMATESKVDFLLLLWIFVKWLGPELGGGTCGWACGVLAGSQLGQLKAWISLGDPGSPPSTCHIQDRNKQNLKKNIVFLCPMAYSCLPHVDNIQRLRNLNVTKSHSPGVGGWLIHVRAL